MKKSKLVLIITLTAICMLGVVMAVYASSANQDGLYAEIITDKENYAINEDIKITVKLENRNDFPVENISIEGLIPDGLTLKNGQVDKNITRLKANEKVELSFVAIKNEKTNINTTEKPTSKKPTTKQPVKRKIKVKSIKLNKKKVTLRRKQSIKLKAKIKPSNVTNKKIKWYSSNKKVAKVNSKGKVTALKKGKAKIYAKAKDGTKKKAVCKVTVKKSKKKNKRK